MAAPNRHQHINCNNSIDSTPVSDFTNYELAYHHHLQTALQMGQFYTPEHLGHSSPASAAAVAAAAALRSSTSSSSIVSSGSLRLIDGSGTPTQNNCHSIWENSRGQRASMAYHHPHAPDLLSVTSALQCDIWPTTPAPIITNGRLPNSGNQQRFGGPKSTPKKPRRRVATISQRRAANIRERRRMFNLNEAFDKLRRKVPTFAYEKRLSRIETLRLAITYISFMRDILTVPDSTKSAGSTERVGKISQSHQNNNGHNNCQYSASNSINNNGVLGMDCLQNQNVPPPMSPFNHHMGRLYSPHPHHPSSTYLHSGISQQKMSEDLL